MIQGALEVLVHMWPLLAGPGTILFIELLSARDQGINLNLVAENLVYDY